METVPYSKQANHFRVIFDDFGTGRHTQLSMFCVTRISRPHLLRYGLFDAADVSPIEIDLRDDEADIARSEVLTQMMQQIKDDARFSLVIETLDRQRGTIEHWRLLQCSIVDCQFDDLNYDEDDRLLIRLKVMPRRIEASLNDSIVELLG